MSAALLAEPTRNQTLAIVAAVVVAASLLYVVGLSKFTVGTYFDDARYIVLARAIAAGQGYTVSSFPDAPPEVKFPPGYPLLLSPVALLFPGSLDAFKIPSLILTAASLPLWLVVLRRRLPFSLSILALGAIATNPLLVNSATIPLSEPPSLFLVGLLFAIADRFETGHAFPLLRSAALAAVVVGLYLVRTVGMAFMLSTTGFLVITRRFRHAFLALALFALPFLLWTFPSTNAAVLSPGYRQEFSVQPGSDSTVTSPVDVVERIVLNARNYVIWGVPNYLQLHPAGEAAPETTRRIFDAVGQPWLTALIPWTAGSIVMVGLLTQLRWPPRFAELGILAYGAALTVWPWAAPRFLEPIGPMLYLFLVLGLGWVLARIAPKASQLSRLGWLAAIILALTTLNVALDIHNIVVPPRERMTDIAASTAWVADHTPSNSIVMGEFSYVQSLYANRRMVDFPSYASIENGDYLDTIQQSKADYILIAPPIREIATMSLDNWGTQLQTALLKHPEEFELMFDSPAGNVHVFRVVHS